MMPNGKDATMPTVVTTTVTRTPPHSDVSTEGKPISGQPLSST